MLLSVVVIVNLWCFFYKVVNMTPKKIGVRGKPLNSQVREIIDNVYRYMRNEADNGLQFPLKEYRRRVLAATGISKNTLQKIKKEGAVVHANEASTSFGSPNRKKLRKKLQLDPTNTYAIKNIIYDFYTIEKRSPTVKGILQKMKDAQLDFDGCAETLRKLIHSIGFSWRKTEDNRSVLIEKHEIRIKRIKFLKELIKYRAEGRNIIYTDETYIHSSHTQSKRWSDGSGKELKKPISKGKRLIIVHAGGEAGFIPNGLLIFKLGIKSGDYHDDMNHKNFMKWVETQLLPNMPERSVLVVDNASYHNVTVEKNVTSASLKMDMCRWLRERDILFDDKLTKPELYEIIKYNKFRFPPVYRLDQLLESRGHKVLRLPPYHPELNPIEKIWALVKNWVAAHNTTFNLHDVEGLTRRRFEELPVEEWIKICRHVKTFECSLIEKDHIMDTSFDHLKFTLNTGSSDEEDWSDIDSDSSVENQPLPDPEDSN